VRPSARAARPALASLLPKVPSQKALARVTDDRVLAEMSKRIFSAGFVWSVIEKKWPASRRPFSASSRRRLTFQPDEFWEGLSGDKRIVRNPQKIKAVRDNALFVLDIAKQHGSFGKFLAGGRPAIRSACSSCWPSAAPASAA
jgi:3-methyladenine DNA glycosylase Tag